MRLIVLKPYAMNYSTYVRDDAGEEVETVRSVRFEPGDIPGMGRLPSVPDIKEDWEDEKGKKKVITKAQLLINLGIMREYGQSDEQENRREDLQQNPPLYIDEGRDSAPIQGQDGPDLGAVQGRRAFADKSGGQHDACTDQHKDRGQPDRVYRRQAAHED